MPEDKRPDLKTFLTDPAFQADRDLFAGFLDDYLAKKAEAARLKKEQDDAANPVNIFDKYFGRK